VATAANITSYSRGINGLMIDIAGLPGTPLLSDFSFTVGNQSAPAQWSAAPTPSAMFVRPGAGIAGSSRVEFSWADGSIKNEWLGIEIKADADTGLAAPDVSYFGNLVGGSTLAAVSGQFIVTTADLAAVRNDPRGFLNPAPVSDPNDFNRDGKVDATDQLIARDNLGTELIQLAAPDSAQFTPANQSPSLPLIASPAEAVPPEQPFVSPKRHHPHTFTS
jgi:hypothetical protein